MQEILISQARKDNKNVKEVTNQLKNDGTGTGQSDSKGRKKQISNDTSRGNRKRITRLMAHPIFRNNPRGVSENEAKEIILKNDFFDKNRNQKSSGFSNRFEMLQINDDKIIFDHTSHLMWQQHGSLESMSFEQAMHWIEELNRIGYGNFNNWRLPTLEEAMSLMKREKNNGSLFKDHIFSQKQSEIWTSDLTENQTMAWVVFFTYGSCYVSCFDLNNYVQAVRSLN